MKLIVSVSTRSVRHPPVGKRRIGHLAGAAFLAVTVSALSGCGGRGERATRVAAPSAGAHEHGGNSPAPVAIQPAAKEIAYYTCSMHTHVRSEVPGKCPICSMDLVPVMREEMETGRIVVDPQRRQAIGVRTGSVERRRIAHAIRAAGKIALDETRLAEVSVKYGGWIEELEVATTGQAVRRGQTLFTLYSPELYAAQAEYLTALASQRRARSTSAPERADYLVEAARQRLRLWDLDEREIDAIATRGEPRRRLPVVSPVSGHVLEKHVVQGAAVEPGMALFRIAPLDRVWVEAAVHESELPLVRVGQEATVTTPNLPGESWRGRVSFVHPTLDDASRTGRVRIELPNPQLQWKPAMYADVAIGVDRGERLVVPEPALLHTGTRALVFVDLGDGLLEPRPVEAGLRSGDWVEVLSGVEEGDRIVVSGTFLVAAESRVKTAAEQWR